jgi:hypothetical protein
MTVGYQEVRDIPISTIPLESRFCTIFKEQSYRILAGLTIDQGESIPAGWITTKDGRVIKP